MTARKLAPVAALLLLVALVAVPVSAEVSDVAPGAGRQCCVGADTIWVVGDWLLCCYTSDRDGRLLTETRAYPINACRATAQPVERPEKVRRITAE